MRRVRCEVGSGVRSGSSGGMQERCSSIRLRRRRDEGRQEFLKSRRSGEWNPRYVRIVATCKLGGGKIR